MVINLELYGNIKMINLKLQLQSHLISIQEKKKRVLNSLE